MGYEETETARTERNWAAMVAAALAAPKSEQTLRVEAAIARKNLLAAIQNDPFGLLEQ